MAMFGTLGNSFMTFSKILIGDIDAARGVRCEPRDARSFFARRVPRVRFLCLVVQVAEIGAHSNTYVARAMACALLAAFIFVSCFRTTSLALAILNDCWGNSTEMISRRRERLHELRKLKGSLKQMQKDLAEYSNLSKLLSDATDEEIKHSARVPPQLLSRCHFGLGT
jgi:hypothetical protein